MIKRRGMRGEREVIFGPTTSKGIAKAMVVLSVMPGGKEFNFVGLLVTRLQTRLPFQEHLGAFRPVLHPHHRHIVCEHLRPCFIWTYWALFLSLGSN